MPERDIRERDILVAPNEYAYVQDLTKGDIVLYVGPTKISLSNTERMIVLREGHFEPVRGDEAGLGVHRFVEATSSQYIILENPPQDLQSKPVKGANSGIPLRFGRKLVVPGPAEFPLWPGQRAQVIDGHELRQNEYLVVRVYDDMGQDEPIGTEIIVRGTDVSFYIPPSGREVVPRADGSYVRRAWRMEKNKGLHLRVVAPFEAGEDAQVPPGRYLAGQDIFVRGREGLFFPTDNLEVVGEVAPIPLAEKEAIYVRALDSGKLTTVEGPLNHLLDPTREELVRRPLDARRATLYQIDPDARAQHRALSIYVPPSTAVMVTAKNKREVVVGPQTRILAYDEELEVLRLSTGRPKSDDELLATCFLQVQGNKVSDLVRVNTGCRSSAIPSAGSTSRTTSACSAITWARSSAQPRAARRSRTSRPPAPISCAAPSSGRATTAARARAGTSRKTACGSTTSRSWTSASSTRTSRPCWPRPSAWRSCRPSRAGKRSCAWATSSSRSP
jgi:hypothetical protein